jgi:hypothetical protein
MILSKRKLLLIPAALLLTASMQGCQTNSAKQAMASGSQVELRSYQTKEYEIENVETMNKKVMMRAVIATLQDLGFVVEKADEMVGLVSARKLDKGFLDMTVTVLDKKTKVVVRANAQYNLNAVEEAEPYQDFFTSLDKGLFLEKNVN